MKFKKRTPAQKLETKISNLVKDKRFILSTNKVKYSNKTLFEYNSKFLKYGFIRVYLNQADPVIEEDFKVTFPLDHENLDLLNSALANPPIVARTVIDLLRRTLEIDFNHIIIGAPYNIANGETVSISRELYLTIKKINTEEGKDRKTRFFNRSIPFLQNAFSKEIKEIDTEKDYALLLQEVINSGKISQEDILSIVQNLKEGDSSEVVIKQQVSKQAAWLIDGLQEIIDSKLTTSKAKQLGNKIFGIPQTNIKGPEHLMESILAKYGQYTLFGVPVLLHTKKYVIHKHGLPRSQFDLILINHLSDVEVVELKRSDAIVLEYDEGRGKFYASKDLSIAISQAERYISAVYKDNDDDYTIEGMKIRQFINTQIGGTMAVEITRPTALIIIGSYISISKDYSELSEKIKKKVTKQQYDENSLQAYKELRGAHKNINILTYSELLDSARTKLELNKEQQK
jgi:hypothetical protein